MRRGDHAMNSEHAENTAPDQPHSTRRTPRKNRLLLAGDPVSDSGGALRDGLLTPANPRDGVGRERFQGFVGPYLLGWVLDRTHSFAAGLVVIGAILIAGGALVLRVRD